MRTFKILNLSLLSLLLIPAVPGRAAVCATDTAPAATLLLPYFEVDLNDPNGRTTLFTINNSDDRAILAHVVLWTDLAVPTFTFDVYLTGYDVQTINLRDIFFQGLAPRTADAGRDPSDSISPKGDFSQDTVFPGCAGFLPPSSLPSPSTVQHLRNAHTGKASHMLQGLCAGFSRGDSVARGYLTVDVVKTCSALRPGDPGYFGFGAVALFDNVLWGDFFYVDDANNFAQGESLVRLEADQLRFANGPTFYGRYVNGTGADGREPLPTAWAARYARGGAFDGGTSLLVWRSASWPGTPFPCGTLPPGIPRSSRGLTAFDEEESATDLVFPGLDPFPEVPSQSSRAFSAVANRVAAGSAEMPLPSDFGWLLMDLRPHGTEPADPYAQAWVGQTMSAQGRFSVGSEGTVLASACPPDRCPSGQETPAALLCIQGPVEAGQPARFRIYPEGCFSSSCTQTRHAGCAVERTGADLRLDSLFCLATVLAGACTPDCSGGGFVECSSAGLAAGIYTAHLGSLALTFTVPSAAGTCIGTP